MYYFTIYIIGSTLELLKIHITYAVSGPIIRCRSDAPYYSSDVTKKFFLIVEHFIFNNTDEKINKIINSINIKINIKVNQLASK